LPFLTRTVCKVLGFSGRSYADHNIDFMGGNSTKATSGINGALTQTQVDTKIADSVKQFYEDTLKSARDKARPDLIKVLTYKSAAAVEWLQEVFNLDLTLVSRLGYAYTFAYPMTFSDNMQRSLLPTNAPWPRCEVPRHGHHIRTYAALRRACREGARSSTVDQEG